MKEEKEIAFNPLLKYPHCRPCICGSGQKFKRCCLKLQPPRIPQDWNRRIVQNWDRLLSGALLIQPPKKVEPPTLRAIENLVEKIAEDG